jgi:hypothetical protein
MCSRLTANSWLPNVFLVSSFMLLIVGGEGGGNERTLLRLRLRLAPTTEPLSATQSFVVR